ncbi:MAG: hypothetical protein QOD83_2624 [Solirubrobacteraceae bacterium]|nr:hypothetical protein [Solirubrobacteraceae bacterium]
MSKLFLAAGVAALAITAPVSAKPGGDNGGGHGGHGGHGVSGLSLLLCGLLP